MMTTRPTMTAAQQARLVARCERAWKACIRAEEAAESMEDGWRLAARSDAARARLDAALRGEHVPAPRTRRNLAKGAFACLAAIGRAVARALSTAARLAKAQAVNAARRQRASMRRAVLAVAFLFTATAAPVVASEVTLTTATTEGKDMKTIELSNTTRKGPKSAAAPRKMRCTAFFRTYNRVPERMNVRTVEFEAAHGAPVELLIELAHKAGASAGARSRAGVFEIQTDEGIWSTPDESKLLTMSHSGLSDKTSFKSWDLMEREEKAARRA